jgi:hypothetical protein
MTFLRRVPRRLIQLRTRAWRRARRAKRANLVAYASAEQLQTVSAGFAESYPYREGVAFQLATDGELWRTEIEHEQI